MAVRRTMAARARAIVAHHLGGPVRRVEALGGGLTNHVFRVRLPDLSVVVRLGEAGGKTEAFVKEQWAAQRGAEAGVPAPRILQVGSDVIDTPYMILEEAVGHLGVGAGDRQAVLTALGAAARKLHGIETQGFGDTFDWSANELSRCHCFGDWLDRLDWRERIAALRRDAIIDEAREAALLATLEDIARDDALPARLNHGDLRLKNIIIDNTDAIVALIDWEDAISAPPELWDLPLALHDLGPDEAQAFLSGYGMDPDRAIALRPRWAAMNAIHYAPFVGAASDAGDQSALRWFRARLMGAFDLFTP